MNEQLLKDKALALISDALDNWAYDDEKAFAPYVQGIINLTDKLCEAPTTSVAE